MRDLNDKTEWTGDWSEKSDKWASHNGGDQLKEQLNYESTYANG